MCCVSDLLEDEPVIRSGRELTYSPGKDTGRYWDAGSVNVHWVIATDTQVAAGIKNAVGRVKASGVFIEGNSFTEYIDPDFFVMVIRPDDLRVKATARSALSRASAFYFSREAGPGDREDFSAVLGQANVGVINQNLPVFTPRSLPALIARLREITAAKAAQDPGQTQFEMDASYAVD